jgi:hypothetical protein
VAEASATATGVDALDVRPLRSVIVSDTLNCPAVCGAVHVALVPVPEMFPPEARHA